MYKWIYKWTVSGVCFRPICRPTSATVVTSPSVPSCSFGNCCRPVCSSSSSGSEVPLRRVAEWSSTTGCCLGRISSTTLRAVTRTFRYRGPALHIHTQAGTAPRPLLCCSPLTLQTRVTSTTRSTPPRKSDSTLEPGPLRLCFSPSALKDTSLWATFALKSLR